MTTGPGTVSIRSSHLETKGYITFTACAPNKARTWNRTLNGVLTQKEIEDLSVLAVREGYDRDFSLRMHKDDLDAFNNCFIYRERILITDGKVTVLESEVGTPNRVVV